MLKNIFRSRRRSKNGPFSDENEPADHSGSLNSKNLFANNPGVTWHEEHVSSSRLGRDQVRNPQPFQLHSAGNVLPATDVRYQHTDTEFISRAASSSQVAGHSGKSNAGHRVDKRRRISSVVNKILMTRSESTPAPRTRSMVAYDLYSPEFSKKDQSDKNSAIHACGTHDNEGRDSDSVFALPYLCQSCSSIAVPGDSGRTKFRSEDSWMCSQCRMQLTKSRDRHRSTVSSPAELSTPCIDVLAVDNSDQLCQPKSNLSCKDSPLDVPLCGKYARNCNSRCDRASCGYCKKSIHGNISDKGKFLLAEDVTDSDGTPCHKDASILPSPLHMYDLECSKSKLSDKDNDDDGGGGDDDVDDDDDIIPELVEIFPQSCSSIHSSAGEAWHYNKHSSPVVQPAVETEDKNVNESAMYILTDSFLDYSSTSYLRNTTMLDTSQSTVDGNLTASVMVADEYELTSPVETNYNNHENLVVSPQFTANADKLYFEREEEPEVLHVSSQAEDRKWCRKSLSDWSSDDVLRWVVSSGLVQFYDTFQSKLLQIIL